MQVVLRDRTGPKGASPGCLLATRMATKQVFEKVTMQTACRSTGGIFRLMPRTHQKGKTVMEVDVVCLDEDANGSRPLEGKRQRL